MLITEISAADSITHGYYYVIVTLRAYSCVRACVRARARLRASDAFIEIKDNRPTLRDASAIEDSEIRILMTPTIRRQNAHRASDRDSS